MKRDVVLGLRIAVPVVGVAALAVALAGSGIVGRDSRPSDQPVRIGAPGISLVSFNSCAAALTGLRAAALPEVTAYGLAGSALYTIEDAAPVPGAPRDVAGADAKAAQSPGSAQPQQNGTPEHSGTNTHEAGVDEPDLVKTDGRRLVTVADGRLRVVDVATRSLTATLDLPGGTATQLLLAGDRALVLTAPDRRPAPDEPDLGAFQTQLVLVDLAGTARVVGTLAVEGSYIDARQVGSVARVVVRSAPHMEFVHPFGTLSEDAALQRNRDIVANAPITAWLPRYTLERNGKRESGTLVDCAALTRPERYTATAMLTVLTADLGRELGSGDPVSIVADGDTVYGTGTSLYLADDHQSRTVTGLLPRRGTPVPAQRTEVYQFDISGQGKPVYVASGGVDGALLSQYSLSEYAGQLRIATTVGDQGKPQSQVVVLRRQGNELVQVGQVAGLGVGERIYAVRFFGPVGYVVTFRQTDPLYTVDLSDPARPRVAGELKITGYSAYLHDAGNGKLIGIGQEATGQGRRTGTQISLFDTGDLAAARRLAEYQLPDGMSEVENDPHAFLYWQEKGIVVVPVMQKSGEKPAAEALVLRLAGDTLTEVGRITHPVDGYGYRDGSVRRALVTGDTLWTVSSAGVLASDLDGLAQRAWIPFT